MKITEEEYHTALKRIDELLPLATEATPDDDCNPRPYLTKIFINQNNWLILQDK